MPDVHASMPDPRDPLPARHLPAEQPPNRHRRALDLAEEAEHHRSLLRSAAADYRWRVAQRVSELTPEDQRYYLDEAERLIEQLMIDPVRHSTLDLDAYRAIRDGVPVTYDSAQRMYVLRRPGRDPLPIRPGLAEHRLGVIARLAGLGLRLDQIQVVALTTAQMVAPHEAAVPPRGAPEVLRGTTGFPSRRGAPVTPRPSGLPNGGV
ncbi:MULTISPECIES: hypothetical protein [unclassified Nocardia]|uniref:hypothetical protein n=1 Tax=unclassified Nocardia TaxID=2637762 RepID=UPI001CE41007|nr:MULTISPECIES: hypothetical protein [unclassified Nocardia]